MIQKKNILLTASLLLLGGCTSSLPPEQEDLFIAIVSPETTSIAPELYNLNNDVEFQDPNGKTPLIYTVLIKDYAKAETILSLRANGLSKFDVDAKDNKGLTALHYAAGQDTPELTRLLLRYGANVNVQDLNGKTPLMEACRLGHTDVAEVLCEAGADRTIRDNQGRTAMIFAAGAKINSLELVNFFLPREEYALLICSAIAAKNNSTAMTLLDQYFPEKQIDKAAGLLILKQAIQSDNREIVKKMLTKNVALNEPSDALYQALRPVRLKNWVRSSANLGLVENGQTPLFWATEQNNTELVKLLLNAGADPNVKDRHRRQPIDYTTNRLTYNALKKAMRK